MSCMSVIEECRANIRRIDAEMAAAVAEIQADATRRILEVYESHAQRRYRFSAGMAIYQMIERDETTHRPSRTVERPAALRPEGKLGLVALRALADAPQGMRMADLARIGVAAGRTEAGMRLAARKLESEGLVERRGHIRLLTPAGVAEAVRSGKSVRRSIEIEVTPATSTEPDASTREPSVEAAPVDVLEPVDEVVVAEPVHVAVEPPEPPAAIPEKERRGTDQVFGKAHPLWEEVSSYAREKVREGGVPLSAGALAEVIRERYPAFEVDARSAPNRFVGMGFRRILWSGSSKVSYWVGDGAPDRLG